jgi:hypothetical protein
LAKAGLAATGRPGTGHRIGFALSPGDSVDPKSI